MENPLIGRRVLIRTYSAGVHIGTLVSAEGMEAHLRDGLRLWQWKGGGLFLSAVAENGIKNGRLNRTSEVFLTNCIEFIPISDKAEASFGRFIADSSRTDLLSSHHNSGSGDGDGYGDGDGSGDGDGYGDGYGSG